MIIADDCLNCKMIPVFVPTFQKIRYRVCVADIGSAWYNDLTKKVFKIGLFSKT